MAQHDYVIDNQSAPNVRTDLNQVFAAIATTNGGGSAPATTYAGQLWHDTTANALKIRNEDNDAWITLMVLDQVNDLAAPPDGSVTFAKLAGAAVVTSSETIASNNNDTTIPTSAAVKAYADAAVGGITSYTDAEARTAQAGHSAGGVGSYAMLARSSQTTATHTPGSTLAGSNLRYAGSPSGDSGLNQVSTTAPSGTWRCMGFSYNFYAGPGEQDFWPATLWLRIS